MSIDSIPAHWVHPSIDLARKLVSLEWQDDGLLHVVAYPTDDNTPDPIPAWLYVAGTDGFTDNSPTDRYGRQSDEQLHDQ